MLYYGQNFYTPLPTYSTFFTSTLIPKKDTLAEYIFSAF